MFKKKNDTEQIKKDFFLLENIQPQGGITFENPRYVQTGTGYETCIHIFGYPNELTDHWMADIANFNNTIATFDISTDNADQILRNLNKSMQEQETRYIYARNPGEAYNAITRYREMEILREEVSGMGEVVKLVHARIYIADYTLQGLEEKVQDILSKLEASEYKAAIFLNETKDEWKSMWQSYSKQKENLFSLQGQPLTSIALGGGNPFHFSSLEDPYGQYIGYTPSGGNVIWDLFHKTTQRLYYNFLIWGEMGSGKSTLLKKIFKHRAILGDYVRTFDVSGEFSALTTELGGKILKADGQEGILNHLEIFRTTDNEKINYMRHFSKMDTIYCFLVPDATRQERMAFQNLLKKFYENLGFDDNKQITGLPSDQYPTYSELLLFVDAEIHNIISNRCDEDLEKVIKEYDLSHLYNIKQTLSYVIFNYGYLLDGHTSIDNITDEQIVTFDISTLKELDPNIFDVQIFNYVSLCWSDCVTNGKIMEHMRREGKIQPEDIVHFLMLIDESHRWINTKKLQALEMIITCEREMRKYYGGIGMASQSMRDYIPEGSSDSEIDKIKTLFELSQYKFTFRQSSSVLPLIDKVFSSTLTVSQKERIPRLGQGETILSMGDESIEFKVYLTKEEEALFTGGL